MKHPNKARVLVFITGGCAEYETVGDVEIKIIDFDNLEAEGKTKEQQAGEYRRLLKWLKRGGLEI